MSVAEVNDTNSGRLDAAPVLVEAIGLESVPASMSTSCLVWMAEPAGLKSTTRSAGKMSSSPGAASRALITACDSARSRIIEPNEWPMSTERVRGFSLAVVSRR